MAACTELGIEEKSSEESSCSAVCANDIGFQDVNLNSRCNAACSANSQKELDTQLKVESETGDLKELSDDEFLHLLKEASTFNKPNNQESILLKQLRKEVDDTDSCEQVRCGESSCVSKRTDRKCSKVSCSSAQNSIEPPTISKGLLENDNNLNNNNTPLQSSRTLNTSAHKKEKDSESPMFLNQRERVAFIEVDPSAQWPTKARKTSLENQSVIEPVKTICNNRKNNESDMTTTLTFNQDAKTSASNTNGAEYKNGKNHGTVEFKLEVEPVPALLIGNYQNFAREIRVPSINSPVSPQKELPGIELTEFKRTKEAEKKPNDASTSKPPSNQLSNSKFYVNCSNEVDNPVNFPLQPLKNAALQNSEEKNAMICDSVNDTLKHRMGFPCFSWSRPQQVHSFLTSTDSDIQSQTDGENNSNPFSRAARAANLTSFVSATLLDYPNPALIPDNQTSKLELSHRKHKRTRNNMENSKIILSQNIEGHRGNEDIDSLVKFIEAADKNDKAFSRGSTSNNHLFSNKTNTSQDTLKRKINGKETKNQNKNCYLSRKKLSQSNSDDSCGQLSDGKQDSIGLDNKLVNSESECSDDSGCNKIKNLPSPSDSEMTPLLDINSNIMEVDQGYPAPIVIPPIASPVPVDGKETDRSSLPSLSPDDSSFASDFYTVTEPVPPAAEESGFCIVKKKQRKKHQGKRSENYRWHSAAARVRQSTSGEREESQHGSSMMLLPGSLVQRNQCGKQDSRRKSTSSVPQSEQSSADNSDLDSVHSLPVRGSAPHPTKPLPHTTPSSSSSTPQASYADIARMPVSSISKLNSSTVSGGSCASAKSTGSMDKSCNVSEMLDEQDMESPLAVSVKLNPTNVEHSATYSSLNRSTREINTQTEPVADDDSQFKSESNLEKNYASDGEESKTCPLCHLFSKGRACSCSRLQKNVSKKGATETNYIPAVLMMGNIPTTEASDISFGVDLTEILQMSASGGDSTKNVTAQSSVNISKDSQPENEPLCAQHHSSACSCNESRAPNANSSCDNSNLCKTDSMQQNCELPMVSSPCREIRLRSGRTLFWIDKEATAQNLLEIVESLSAEFKKVQAELSSDINKTEGKVQYYRSDGY